MLLNSTYEDVIPEVHNTIDVRGAQGCCLSWMYAILIKKLITRKHTSDPGWKLYTYLNRFHLFFALYYNTLL
mgnify:CR=1 FL=1